MIHPSPALRVRADTSIADCVRLMREHEVGSVLVLSDDFHEKLLGIFTERDLLRRIAAIEEGGYWKKPVHAFMTKPVITIPLERLDEAPRVMVQKGFRHLPVTARGPGGESYLAGVVSMRDFFREWVRERWDELAPRKASRRANEGSSDEIRVYSDDPALLKLLTLKAWRLRRFDSVPALEVTLSGRARESRASSVPLVPLVLDADGIDPARLAGLLKRLLSARPRPKLVIAFDPARHPARVHALLDRLGGMRGVSVFKRPFNLLALSAVLNAGGGT